jgi:hypothetical protein
VVFSGAEYASGADASTNPRMAPKQQYLIFIGEYLLITPLPVG